MQKLHALAVAAGLVGGGLVLGGMLRPALGQVAGGRGGVEGQASVYVRDSALASDKFELGKRMERLKEWHKSADVYQEILEKYRDRVVPVQMNEKQQPMKYSSVTEAVQQRLARWPEEGLGVYRGRFEPVASALLEASRRDDLGTPHRVFDLYFATNSGKQAGIRLMDLYLEAGDFPAATWIGDKLLAWHPGLAVERPGVLFRTALAYHLAGHEEQARKRLEELKAGHGNEIGTVGGGDVNLAEALGRALASKPPVGTGKSAGDSWTTFGGDASRSLVGTAAGTPGARIYKVEVPPPALGEAPNKQAIIQAYESARNMGLTINVMPVHDRGELFFQDGLRVWAVHVESGVPLPGWQQTYPTRQGQYWLPAQASPLLNMVGEPWLTQQMRTPRQHTLTVTEEAVVAVMGLSDLRMPGGQSSSSTRLVCLDRATGRQRWLADPAAAPNNPGGAKSLNFSGSPLVVGDNVYVIARGNSGAGVEECHVYCYDLNQGTCRFSAYIASAQTGGFNMGGIATASTGESLSHLAFSSGRLFVLTNLGAVAAVDAYSGGIAWLTIYPRNEEMLRRGPVNWWGGMQPAAAGGSSPKPWEMDSAVVSDGKVFVLPTDGKCLLVYDAGTGEELRRIDREIEVAPNKYKLSMLVGVMGEKLVVAGNAEASSSGLFVLDWAKYGQKRPRDLLNATVKLDEEATFYWGEFAPLRGRPFLTSSRVYVPTENGLSMVDLGLGRVTRNFPAGGGVAKWPDDEGPGNVLVTQDQVVVANARNVSVYTDLANVRQKYERAIQADPGDVEARLVFAELMFNARELEEASKALDEAIGVLGGLKSMRPGPHRDRLFSDAVLFAQKLGEEKNPAAQELADGLFDRAAAAALNASQQVHYRLSRARFLENRRARGAEKQAELARAVELYQEVLSSAEMRLIALAEDSGATVQAGKLAEEAIDKIIRQSGQATYAVFAKEAQEKLEALRAGGSPEQLLALAENYPNATTVAAQAMMLAAERFEKNEAPRMATQVLRRLYWKYAGRFGGEERARLVEAMARNYLKVGNLPAALGHVQRLILQQPQARLSSPLVMPDGKALAGADGKAAESFRQAAELLGQLNRERLDLPLADVKFPPPLTTAEKMARKPIPKPFERPGGLVIGNVQALVESPAYARGGVRHDRIVVVSEGKLLCLGVGQDKPLWTSTALTQPAVALYWIDQKLLVWGEDQLALLDGEKGQTIWKGAASLLPPVELLPGGNAGDGPLAGGAPPPPADNVDEFNALVLAQQRVAMVPPLGVVAAQVNVEPEVVDQRERLLQVRVLSDRLVAGTSTGRVFALDLGSGKTLWQTRLSSGRGIQQTLATDDFAVIRLAEGQSVQLVVLDSFNGQQIHRKSFSTIQPSYPINCALSEDGMLVWTTPHAIAAKDLYEREETRDWARPGRSSDQRYTMMSGPEQLMIAGAQVLALYANAGKNMVELERRDLRSGNELGPAIELKVMDVAARIRLSGPRVYVGSNRSLLAYHLEHNTACPGSTSSDEKNATVFLAGDMMLSRDYTLLPSMSSNGQGAYQLWVYSRALVPDEMGKPTESGLLVYQESIAEPSKIRAWQAVEGGVYYLAGDEKLHWLKGNGGR